MHSVYISSQSQAFCSADEMHFATPHTTASVGLPYTSAESLGPTIKKSKLFFLAKIFRDNGLSLFCIRTCVALQKHAFIIMPDGKTGFALSNHEASSLSFMRPAPMLLCHIDKIWVCPCNLYAPLKCRVDKSEIKMGLRRSDIKAVTSG